MKSGKLIDGFSKMTVAEKISWLQDNYTKDKKGLGELLAGFGHEDEQLQNILNGFSENTLTNFPLPYSIAPNFLINDQVYAVPMVIEESSVVAAASAAAKYWSERGGFVAEVIATEKVGQIHMTCDQDAVIFRQYFESHKQHLLRSCDELIANMDKRGGGIKNMELLDFPEEADYYQVRMTFETCDSMGANFINSVLETFAKAMVSHHREVYGDRSRLQVVMCILSNYTPNCLVRSEVSCKISEIGAVANLSGKHFAYKYEKAVRIAHIDPYRATTHNKGVYNGVDAVALATGNDFRAIEACGHTYAGRDGKYRSLTHCDVSDGIFKTWIEIPMAVGTVGGLTRLHPLAKTSLEILGQPSSEELMMIIASTGLAQNFSAIKSLISTGIQQGHMRMHLSNVLYQLKATEQEFKMAIDYFKDKIVSHRAVQEFLQQLRSFEPGVKEKKASRS